VIITAFSFDRRDPALNPGGVAKKRDGNRRSAGGHAEHAVRGWRSGLRGAAKGEPVRV